MPQQFTLQSVGGRQCGLAKTRQRWCAPTAVSLALGRLSSHQQPAGVELHNVKFTMSCLMDPCLDVPTGQHDLQLARVALTVSCLMDSGPKASRLNSMTCSCSMAACCSSSVLLERRRCMRSMAACSSCTGTGSAGCHGCPAEKSSAAPNACCAACPATQAWKEATGLHAPHGRLLQLHSHRHQGAAAARSSVDCKGPACALWLPPPAAQMQNAALTAKIGTAAARR